MMRRCSRVWFVAGCVLLVGCMRLTIEPVDYSWRLESVMSVAEDGSVKGAPKTPSFNAAELYRMELGEVPQGGKRTLRVIRSRLGHYFVTAPSFRHVYVFSPGVERLSLCRKILVNPDGLQQPAFNQRDPYIQLIDAKRAWMLTEKGISGEAQ